MPQLGKRTCTSSEPRELPNLGMQRNVFLCFRESLMVCALKFNPQTQGASNTYSPHGQTPPAHSNMSILEASIIMSRGYNPLGSFSMEKQGLPGDASVVSAESFFEIKDALRK